jgi:hypothetical protein
MRAGPWMPTSMLIERRRGRPWMRPILLGALAAVALANAWAQSARIYSCVDDKGRRLTSDRPIPECVAREQREHNRDGSVRAVRPPVPTAEERAAQEVRERQAAAQRQAENEARRRDRQLLARYPNEATHRKAREGALDSARQSLRASENRLAALATERKPLNNEAEFYLGRALPPKLKQQIDANDAAVEAQRAAMVNQEAELVRLNRLYDIELDRLRRLWAGAAPGSLGPLPTGAAAMPATASMSSAPAPVGALPTAAR